MHTILKALTPREPNDAAIRAAVAAFTDQECRNAFEYLRQEGRHWVTGYEDALIGRRQSRNRILLALCMLERQPDALEGYARWLQPNDLSASEQMMLAVSLHYGDFPAPVGAALFLKEMPPDIWMEADLCALQQLWASWPIATRVALLPLVESTAHTLESSSAALAALFSSAAARLNKKNSNINKKMIMGALPMLHHHLELVLSEDEWFKPAILAWSQTMSCAQASQSFALPSM